MISLKDKVCVVYELHDKSLWYAVATDEEIAELSYGKEKADINVYRTCWLRKTFPKWFLTRLAYVKMTKSWFSMDEDLINEKGDIEGHEED